MARFTAFYDANVLYPAELRNLLMHLALTGLFRAKWSADVHEEWISALLEKRPDLTRDNLERTRALMDLHAVDALVTGDEDLIPGLRLPDPNDRHVLAAAIRGQADVIVTMNLRDFPAQIVGNSESRRNIPTSLCFICWTWPQAPCWPQRQSTVGASRILPKRQPSTSNRCKDNC